MTYEAAGDLACSSPARAATGFGGRLRAARLAAGYPTARQFALALGLAENRYTRYERDETEPALGTVARICQLLRITPDDLLGFPRLPLEIEFPPGLGERPSSPISCGGYDVIQSTEQATVSGLDDRLVVGQRRWLCWQLASECAELEHSQSAPESAIAKLRRTCELFRSIERDPLGFIAAVVESTAVDNLPAARQQRLALAIETLCGSLADRPAAS